MAPYVDRKRPVSCDQIAEVRHNFPSTTLEVGRIHYPLFILHKNTSVVAATPRREAIEAWPVPKISVHSQSFTLQLVSSSIRLPELLKDEVHCLGGFPRYRCHEMLLCLLSSLRLEAYFSALSLSVSHDTESIGYMEGAKYLALQRATYVVFVLKTWGKSPSDGRNFMAALHVTAYHFRAFRWAGPKKAISSFYKLIAVRSQNMMVSLLPHRTKFSMLTVGGLTALRPF